jgi:uncharacterized SAM-binding protein YcdF (DUF218 family)
MTIETAARIVWDYHLLHHKLEKADAIVVLGSSDTRVAEHGARLYLDGWAPLLVFSGGTGKLSAGMWNGVREADYFASIAKAMGAPENAILIENESTNTGENIQFTRALFEKEGIQPNKLIVVQKPYMERRTHATIKKRWPEMDFIVSSPPISFDDYPNDNISKERMLNVMVGDLQRIKEYPAKGFQIEQEIPDEVWRAYETLVGAGYTEHLLQ